MLFTKSVTIMQPPYVLYFIVLYNFCITTFKHSNTLYLFFLNQTQVVRAVCMLLFERSFCCLYVYSSRLCHTNITWIILIESLFVVKIYTKHHEKSQKVYINIYYTVWRAFVVEYKCSIWYGATMWQLRLPVCMLGRYNQQRLCQSVLFDQVSLDLGKYLINLL